MPHTAQRSARGFAITVRVVRAKRTAATLATMASCMPTLMMGSTVPVDIQMGTVLEPSCGTEYLRPDSQRVGELCRQIAGRKQCAEPRFVPTPHGKTAVDNIQGENPQNTNHLRNACSLGS